MVWIKWRDIIWSVRLNFYTKINMQLLLTDCKNCHSKRFFLWCLYSLSQPCGQIHWCNDWPSILTRDEVSPSQPSILSEWLQSLASCVTRQPVFKEEMLQLHSLLGHSFDKWLLTTYYVPDAPQTRGRKRRTKRALATLMTFHFVRAPGRQKLSQDCVWCWAIPWRKRRQSRRIESKGWGKGVRLGHQEASLWEKSYINQETVWGREFQAEGMEGDGLEMGAWPVQWLEWREGETR